MGENTENQFHHILELVKQWEFPTIIAVLVVGGYSTFRHYTENWGGGVIHSGPFWKTMARAFTDEFMYLCTHISNL